MRERPARAVHKRPLPWLVPCSFWGGLGPQSEGVGAPSRTSCQPPGPRPRASNRVRGKTPGGEKVARGQTSFVASSANVGLTDPLEPQAQRVLGLTAPAMD